jgi:hypothetical protein
VNIRENRRGKSRMYNPETLLIFGAQESRRRQTKQQQQNIYHRKLSGRANPIRVDETCVPGKNNRPVASHLQTHNVISNTPRHERESNSQLYW